MKCHVFIFLIPHQMFIFQIDSDRLTITTFILFVVPFFYRQMEEEREPEVKEGEVLGLEVGEAGKGLKSKDFCLSKKGGGQRLRFVYYFFRK